jgi:hypothetical protein
MVLVVLPLGEIFGCNRRWRRGAHSVLRPARVRHSRESDLVKFRRIKLIAGSLIKTNSPGP